jgi:DNA-binding transcriptional ArsR family regulator
MPITLPAVAHALSDPTRLAILERLRRGEHCVCALTDLLEAGQSRLSFHLRVLKDSGLVDMRRSGRRRPRRPPSARPRDLRLIHQDISIGADHVRQR